MEEFMTPTELTKAINSVTDDWSLRGPYHEDNDKYFALLRGEWVGNGYETRWEALKAIYEEITKG